MVVEQPRNVRDGLLGVGPLQAIKVVPGGATSRCHSQTFALLFGALSAIGLVLRLIRTITGDVARPIGAFGVLVGGAVAFWITVGAWRRTVWSEEDTTQPDAAD